MNDDIECVFIELSFKHAKNILVGFIYKQPKVSNADWVKTFENTVSKITTLGIHVILLYYWEILILTYLMMLYHNL